MSNGNDGSTETTRPDGGGERVASGDLLGVRWTARVEVNHVQLTIGGRAVHVTPDDTGTFVTHEMVGRWPDLRELAEMIIKYHPEYSPLARRNRNIV